MHNAIQGLSQSGIPKLVSNDSGLKLNSGENNYSNFLATVNMKPDPKDPSRVGSLYKSMVSKNSL